MQLELSRKELFFLKSLVRSAQPLGPMSPQDVVDLYGKLNVAWANSNKD